MNANSFPNSTINIPYFSLLQGVTFRSCEWALYSSLLETSTYVSRHDSDKGTLNQGRIQEFFKMGGGTVYKKVGVNPPARSAEAFDTI